MTLLELGQKLKQEREAKGISLEQIQQKTKISVHILKAIEQGDTSLLPHPVYAKGFVQNYARNLGLDWRDIGEQFASLYSVDDEYENLEELPTSLDAKLGRRRLYRSSKIIALSALGIILVVLVWLAISSFFSSEKDVQGIEKNSSLLEEKQKNDIGLGQNGSGTINDSESKNSSGLIFEAGNETVVDENGKEVKETEESKNDTVKKEKLPVLNDQEQADKLEKVTIKAFEPCWIQAKIDEVQREFYLRPGEKIGLKFTKYLRLRLGNAGGVKLTYNDQDYPLQAKSGQVKTLEFTSTDSQ
ncbi:helix-turn-helix domain-containing protein [Desulfovulcanus sp.]